MTMLPSPRVLYSVSFYLLTIALVCVSRPAIAFNADGSIKRFGVGPHASVVSLGVLVCVTSVLCFYAFCLVDLVFRS